MREKTVFRKLLAACCLWSMASLLAGRDEQGCQNFKLCFSADCKVYRAGTPAENVLPNEPVLCYTRPTWANGTVSAVAKRSLPPPQLRIQSPRAGWASRWVRGKAQYNLHIYRMMTPVLREKSTSLISIDPSLTSIDVSSIWRRSRRSLCCRPRRRGRLRDVRRKRPPALLKPWPYWPSDYPDRAKPPGSSGVVSPRFRAICCAPSFLMILPSSAIRAWCSQPCARSCAPA